MNAWLKRNKGPDEVIRVAVDTTMAYDLYKAYEEVYLGRILFDEKGYWIYDGDQLTVDEQEQLGKFIQFNMEVLSSS